ncbi:TetR/AcrR family transcriptional regulator [Mycobacteroides abscessus]|uniref:TetR family regulatory protein n=4 Tax=Mycobacteroides abscessus TaxID=36809 RepID=B1MG34_MYCA9|nr:TetR/AcrR family transcriptional regulator [Mycobacteroides abscessus]EIV07797.1 tetR family regulatory protein [Mycobacteroides abscessus 4S-0206]EIV22717.1 tetR family regulatory protein [Mycobacteroides abscessus 3A-0119-R]EIV48578.1 tetR family regulatory protein [Mycobacteroides abscessus 4S-0116-R]EPZ22287.1 TetR family transcriptional regulator [Mycobacteroides abscessus V06705]ETZ90806.1 tetR family regulatory protein [Mycobacteroides abscessus MAB_030201_1075]EUA48834.1 tetR famil
MPPDASATKKRLLDAAYAEFAEHGLAGARVDRIGAAAEANKRLLYVYYTNKETLFDIVVAHSIQQMSEAVPFTPEDLPGYAGALFDHLIKHPEHLRLATWAQLERPAAGPAETSAYAAKVAAIAQTGLSAGDVEPADILALTLGLTTAWLGASPALRGLAASEPFSPERLATHRTALIAAVEALVSAAAR